MTQQIPHELWHNLLSAAKEVLANVIDSGSQGPSEYDPDISQLDEIGTPWFADYYALRQAVRDLDGAGLQFDPETCDACAGNGFLPNLERCDTLR